MKLIPLVGAKHGKGKFAIVDDCDYAHLSQFKWFCVAGYAKRQYSPTGKFKDRTQISMHREITGAREGETVDHIDLDRLNNTRANLRICTMAQNLYNKKATKVNKLGVKGVFLNSPKRMLTYKRKYRAKCKVNGIVYLDRTYETIEEAKAAYDAVARVHQGEFSRS